MGDATENDRVKPLQQVRLEHIVHVLQATDGDLDRASRILGVSVASLRRTIKQHGIDVPSDKDKREPK